MEGARVAGVDKHTRLELEDTTLTLEVEPDTRRATTTRTETQLPQLGDAAIRSVVDILTGRQEPPR